MKSKLIQGLALLGISTGVIVFAGVLVPRAPEWMSLGEDGGFALCGVKALTGVPCPFCGGMRASAALFTGATLEALWWNPVAVLGHGALWLTGLMLLVGKTPWWLQLGKQMPVFRAAAVALFANWIYLVAVGR